MKTNVAVAYGSRTTHEGGNADRISPEKELRRSVLTCMLFEGTFYEEGSAIAARIAELVPKVEPQKVADLAIEARNKMYLRHVPLFLIRELAHIKGTGQHVERALTQVIQRADEMGEFLSIYWKDKRQPISAAAKRALAKTFPKFDEYALAKYDRDGAVKIRDVMFLVRPKPKDEAQAELWKRVANRTLATPDTWEVSLSRGDAKRGVFERLLRERKLGALALLRNLRNMQESGVDDALIRQSLENSRFEKILPFRFVAAAKVAPTLEDSLETGMFRAVQGYQPLSGKTGLLIDVSGSMDYRLGKQQGESTSMLQLGAMAQPSETSRIDVAAALAILVRELCPAARIATFSEQIVEIPARRGFALRDGIKHSQEHRGTRLKAAVDTLSEKWKDVDRLIIITDEQSQDGNGQPFAKLNYLINVAPNQNGVSYGGGWTHIDGWSENVVSYIQELEQSQLAA